ncbi:unnamed protein product [Camellia sinensis]
MTSLEYDLIGGFKSGKTLPGVQAEYVFVEGFIPTSLSRDSCQYLWNVHRYVNVYKSRIIHAQVTLCSNYELCRVLVKDFR